MNALSKARQYVEEFDGNIASFIFGEAEEPAKPSGGGNLQRAAATR